MDCWYELVEDVIFANSFFALEETGLAYPSLSSADDDESKAMDAWLRVFASGNRVQEGKFFERNNFTQWDSAQRVPHSNRVWRFADKVFGAAWSAGLLNAFVGQLGEPARRLAARARRCTLLSQRCGRSAD
jgi:hypothetical protein